jgi:hypothetical protein
MVHSTAADKARLASRPVTVRERSAGRRQVSFGSARGAAELANIEIGEISLVPKLSHIWCRNSVLSRQE